MESNPGLFVYVQDRLIVEKANAIFPGCFEQYSLGGSIVDLMLAVNLK